MIARRLRDRGREPRRRRRVAAFPTRGREGEWRIRIWEESGAPLRGRGSDVPGAPARDPPTPPWRTAPRRAARLVRRRREGDELRATSSTDAERLAFLRSRGYEVDGQCTEFVYHACELDDRLAPAVPHGYRLRTVELPISRRGSSCTRWLGAVARDTGELHEAADRVAVSCRPRLRGRGTRRVAGRLLPRVARR